MRHKKSNFETLGYVWAHPAHLVHTSMMMKVK